MIHNVLAHIRDSINLYYKNEFDKDKVLVLSNLQNSDGTTPDRVANKMVFFMTGMHEEATLKNGSNRNGHSVDGMYAKSPKVLNVNIYLLFCANFEGDSGYEKGLAYLSALVRFFQINKVMMAPNERGSLSETNGSKPSTEPSRSQSRLTFELCKLDYNEMSHLWSAVGSKLLPSALYKVGILSFDDVPISGTVPKVKSL